MNEGSLNNYLKSSRRRLGLTQDHLAFILNLKSASRISSLERGHSRPKAAECLIFQKLFGVPVAEIWPQWAVEIGRTTDARIRELLGRLGPGKRRSARHAHRAQYLVKQLNAVLDRLLPE